MSAQTPEHPAGSMSATPPEEESTGYAWFVVAVLTSVYMLSFIDRTILGMLVGPIQADLGISDTEFGVLTGFMFTLFYVLMGVPLGRLADTYSRRNLVIIGIIGWSFFTSASSLAGRYLTLSAARVGVGVGEASLSPSAYSMITDYFPNKKLGVPMSVYNMGIFLGISAAFLVGGTIIDMVSQTEQVVVPILGAMPPWRVTFLIVGLPGLLFALLMLTVREPKRKNVRQSASGAIVKLSVGEVAHEIGQRWQSLIGISVGMIFQSCQVYTLLTWATAIFQRSYDWTPGQTGRPLALLLLTFGCAGMYVGGVWSDRWLKKGVPEAPLKIGVFAGMGTLVFFTPALSMSNPTVALALLAPSVFLTALPMGITIAALQRIFPNQARAQVSAVFLFFLNLGGFPLGAILPGLLNDRFFGSEAIGTAASITIGIAAVMMIVSFSLTAKPYRGHYSQMQVD
jgi:MFS family permease